MSALLAALILAGQTQPKEVHVWVSHNVAPGKNIQLVINTRNVPVVYAQAFPVDALAWLSRVHKPDERPRPNGPELTSWSVTVKQPGQVTNPNDNYFSRRVNVPIERPGVYLLHFAGGGKTATEVVNVTNLAIVNKRDQYHDLVWVTDHKTGQCVADADARFYTSKGEYVLSSHTGDDGCMEFAFNKPPEILVVNRGRDYASVPVPVLNYDGRLNAFWQTDRPIYRSGQTIYFKTVLRRTLGQGYSAESGRKVSVSLLDPRETALDTFSFTANANGSVSGEFKIPQEGMLGAYTIDLRDGDDDTRKSISVAEYRKPEFKVDASAEQKRYLAGEKIRFNLTASYYFGAPLPQAAVTWVARRNGIPFYQAGIEDRWFYSGDGNLYPRDRYATQPFVAEGTTATDKDGKATIEVPTDLNGSDSDYSIEATVVDATHRQSQVSASVPVYASNLRIDLTPEIQAVALGGLVPVRVRLVDLDGNPKAGRVTLRVITNEYDDTKGWHEKVLTEKHVQVPTSGYLREILPALAGGDLIMEAAVTDDTGRSTKARTMVWVMDPNYTPPKEKPQPELSLKLDKRVYTPGDTVHAYVTDNTPDRPILVVEEGLTIWTHRVYKGRAFTYEMKTSTKMSPNAYLSVTQWPSHQQLQQTAIVPLPDRSKLLNVTVTPSKPEVKPGEVVQYHVTTKDQSGSPVPAELCLNVVDEAIYALAADSTGDSYEQYWGLRPNYVESMSSDPEEVSGGAFQRAAPSSPSVRTRFEDTAYWNAFVTTDATGQADVKFEAPGNLTTWRATAHAFTPGTQVGEATTKIIASRPLTMRLALPRQMTSGDQLTIQGTINNRTKTDVQVDTSLKVDGADLLTAAKQTVKVPAGGQTVVNWDVRTPKVPPTGNASFEAVAQGESNLPDMNDALRMSIPVYPRGYKTSASAGGAMESKAETTLNLPPDSLGEAIALHARVFKGVTAEATADAQGLIQQRYGSPAAADALIAAIYLGPDSERENIREAQALLSRDMQPNGWGWWEGSVPEPTITAQVAHALALSRKAGIPIYKNLLDTASGASEMQYAQIPLWEYRAQLAASQAELGLSKGAEFLKEVQGQGQNMSPFARLRMVQGFLALQDKDNATKELEAILPLVSRGAGSSYLPVGEGVGWTASSIQSTAALLQVLVQMDVHSDLQQELVQWLLSPQVGDDSSGDDDAWKVEALGAYLKKHPETGQLGSVTLTVNGTPFELKPSTVDASASIDAYNVALKPGKNSVSIARHGSGAALYRLSADFFRPAENESHFGLRVARRYEVRNEAGVWTEINRTIKPGEPVRVTLSIWGDDIPDAVRIDEPLPAGFEFVDSEVGGRALEEVRDRAVVHYLTNAGTPITLRYYLRAEAGGNIVAQPASGQYLRRPAVLGHGAEQPLVVGKG